MSGPKSLLLVSLLFQERNPDHQHYQAVASRISSQVSKLGNILQNEATRDMTLLHMDRALLRLERLFEVLKTTEITSDISERLFRNIVCPLIQLPDEIVSPTRVVFLVGSALSLLLACRSPYLYQVAEDLIAIEGLVDRLSSHENCSLVLKHWLTSKNNYLDGSLTSKFTQKLIDLCDNCAADHSIGNSSQKWQKLKTLTSSLTQLVKSVYQQEKKENQTRKDLPILAGMKRLSADDKKTSRARQATGTTQSHIPEAILEQLALFDIPKPESARALQMTLQRLEGEEVHSLMRTALDSFPCRFCWERVTGNSSFSKQPLVASEPRILEANIKCDIFGKRVGLWKVLLSDKAWKSARKLARAGTFNRVEQKLRELADGDWKGKELSTRAGSKQQKREMRVPILQAATSNRLYLLWQLDVGFYEEAPRVRQQIVKVWDIITVQELPKAIDQIILLQQIYAPAVIQKCCERPFQQTDGKFLPRRFDDHEVAQRNLVSGAMMVPKLKSETLIEMSNKFYNLTEPFLKSIIEATGLEEFPFDLSPDEMEIVSHFNTSSLILGRSGTGKTTCLVFKILAKYKARQLIPDERPVKQLLLTRSAYLASKLQNYAKSLIETQSLSHGARKSDGASSTSDGVPPKYDSIFSLDDRSYPFVCTYDEFLRLLDNTIKRADRKNFLHSDEGSTLDDANNHGGPSRTFNGQRLIDFNVFKTEYWSSLSGMLASSCAPELLFSEIMGVIKGSSSSARTLTSLTHDQYISKSCRLAPAFTSEADRDRVYSAFERYEKLKRQRDEVDELDRVITLLMLLKENPALGELIRQSFEEIYVDEVQDLRCLDILLLMSSVCDARGIHLAGDTAQCISKDSVFRFPEIKALFHEYYDFLAGETGQFELAKPTQFSLAKNYRSHQGILSVASCVMQMLWTGFPDTIDKLDPEIGHLGGPRPIIFAGFDSGILSAKMIGLVKLHDRVADFGAEQVILVRDDAAKDKLQKQIGEIALVLTILESKGMEFDDVLAHDFFSGNGLGSSYRCLHLLVRGDKSQFDAQKHAGLCSELKHLYVAITRARNQLWFVESCENSVAPVIACFNRSENAQLVDVVKQNDPDVAEKVKVLRAGGSVDPERWLKRGTHLFHQKNFADALFCFKKADDRRGMRQCQACLYEQDGRTCRAEKDMQGFSENYEKAVALFLEIDLISEAASCLEGLREYERVARLWKEQQQFKRAAIFFEKADLFKDASNCYHLDGNYEQAVEVLRRGDQFDHLIEYINCNKNNVLSTTLRRYSRLCNILLKQGRVSPDLRAKTISLLGSDDEKEEFFKEFEMFGHLSSFYRSKERYHELYELSTETGDLVAALEVAISHNISDAAGAEGLKNVFNYVMAEEMFIRKGLHESEDTRYSIVKRAGQSRSLAILAQQWRAAMCLFDTIKNEGRIPESLKIGLDLDAFKDEGGTLGALELVKDFFCLFVIAFDDQIFKPSTMANLPVDLLTQAGKLLHYVSCREKSSCDCLLLLCGIFSMPGQARKPIRLPWSPIPLEAFQSTECASLEELVKFAMIWIGDRFSKAFFAFEATAMEFWRLPRRCIYFLVRGHCQRQRTNECAFTHVNTTVEFHSRRLSDLLRISSAIASMTPLYLQRIMDDGFQSHFLGCRRRWLEFLNEELAFATSFEQAASAIITAKGDLQNNPNFAATVSCLEDLLFHRIGREWQERQTLTLMLEQVQLAHHLGPEVSGRFFRALQRKVRYNLFHSKSAGDCLGNDFHAVHAIEKIRWAVVRRDGFIFYSAIQALLQSLEQTGTKSLSAFPALLSAVEFTATFLLCMVNPRNAVAIPWSWAVLHLPFVMNAQVEDLIGITEQEKHMYTGCLLNLVAVFCKLTSSLEWALTGHEITFQSGRRRGIHPQIVRRRNIEFLLTIALNLGSWPILPRGMSDMWTQIQKVLAFSAPPGIANIVTLLDMRSDFIRNFQLYAGKDSFHVITLDNSDDGPTYLRDLVVLGAQVTKLKVVLETTQGSKETMVSVQEDDDDSGEEYSKGELKTIISLQRRWRRTLSRIQEDRRMRQTRGGKILLSLLRLCSTHLDMKSRGFPGLSVRQMIAIRAVSFTDGMTVLTEIDEIANEARKLREGCKVQLENALSTSELEHLDGILVKLVYFEGKLRGLAQIWSIDALEKSTMFYQPEVLKSKAREALRNFKSMRRELESIRDQLSPGSLTGNSM